MTGGFVVHRWMFLVVVPCVVALGAPQAAAQTWKETGPIAQAKPDTPPSADEGGNDKPKADPAATEPSAGGGGGQAATSTSKEEPAAQPGNPAGSTPKKNTPAAMKETGAAATGSEASTGATKDATVAEANKSKGSHESDESKPTTRSIKPALSPEWVKTLHWRSIGPAAMGGRITAIAVYEADPCVYWIATASGGLLKTTNNGITFEHQFDHEATVSIGDVAVAPSDQNIVWVGTGEANPRNSVSWGDGVYKSTDGGKTWKNMGLKESFQIGRIAIHPTDPNIVYVGALGRLWGPNEQRGLYKTTDGGETWEKVLYVDDKTGVVDVKMNPADPDTLLAATYERQRDGFDTNDPKKKLGPGSGLYKTTDAGKTWRKITQGLPTCDLGRIGIDYYRKAPDTVYLVLESKHIAQEPDDAPYMGVRGEDVEVGAKLTDIIEDGPAKRAELKVGDIVVSVDDVTIHSYNDLVTEIRKHSAGQTARFELSRDRKSVLVDVTFDKRPELQEEEKEDSPSANRRRTPFSAGLGGQRENVHEQQGKNGYEYGGVYKSTDGGESWTRINSVNPRPMYFSQIRVDPSDDQYLYVLGVSLYRSKDGGQTFTGDGGRDVHPDHHALWIDPKDGRHMILGNDGGVYVTQDRMEKWDHLNHMAIGQFYHVGVGPRRNYRVYGGLQDNGSWGGPSRARSGDGPVNDDWFRIGGGDGFICRVDPEDADQLYFEAQNGTMGRFNLRTNERSMFRPKRQRGVKYRFNWKTPFILSHLNPKIYYTAGNFVFRSLARGAKLKKISPEITRTQRGSATALAESPIDPDVLYVGTDDGAMWATRDGGHEWSKIIDFPDDEPEKKTEDDTVAGAGDAHAHQTAPEPGEAAESTTAGKKTDVSNREKPKAAGEAQSAQTPKDAPRPGGRLIDRIMRRDANGDGKIQLDEVPQRMRMMFGRIDTNGDGALDKSELEALAERMSGARRRPPRPPMDGTQDRHRHAASAFDAAHWVTVAAAAVTKRFRLAGDKKPTLTPKDTQPHPNHETTNKASKTTGGNSPKPTPATGGAEEKQSDEGTPKTADQPQEKTGGEKKPQHAGGGATPRHDQAGPDEPHAALGSQTAETSEAHTKSKTASNTKSGDKPSSSEDDPLSGEWAAVAHIEGMPPGQGEFSLTLKLKPDGKVTGSMEADIGEGTISEGSFNRETGRLRFVAESERAAMEFTARVSGATMSGDVDVGDGMFSFEFDARRSSTSAIADADVEEPTPDKKEYEWKPLTEWLPGPRWVSSLEASRFEEGRVYVTLDGHRSDDDEPYIFVSENHGETWRPIRANLPTAAGSTRVIREDIENPNILYLGTEFGAWVTIDRGASWTKFNSNLPTVAVHEFAIHPTAGEIVAATHGRSLWILDVTPLRQMAGATLKENVVLYKPEPSIYWRPQPSRGGGGARRFMGENPVSGAPIYYSLRKPADNISLKIIDLAGKTIRELDADYEPGLHRVEWNLRKAPRRRRHRRPAERRRRGGREGRRRFARGRLVESGKYLVALTVDDETYTQELRVETDPEYPDYRPWELEEQELRIDEEQGDSTDSFMPGTIPGI